MRRTNQELKKKKKLLKQKQIFEQSFFEFSNGNTGMTKHQFVIFILKHLGIIDQEQHIDPWLRKFEELDINRMGYLNAEVRSSLLLSLLYSPLNVFLNVLFSFLM